MRGARAGACRLGPIFGGDDRQPTRPWQDGALQESATPNRHRYTHSVYNLLLRDGPRPRLSEAPIRRVPVSTAKIAQKVQMQMNTCQDSFRSKPFRSE